MREASATWASLIAYTHPMRTRVSSYLDGVELASSVPITNGKITFDDTGTIKRRLTISVPARDPSSRWDPAGNMSHPLAVYGQRLKVCTGMAFPNGAVEMLDVGWFLITHWTRNEAEGTIEVEAVDLAQLLIDDRLALPSAPPSGATFRSEFARLVGTILPVDVSSSPADRAVSPTLLWDKDRDIALNDLCAAWPARWYVDDAGAATVAPAYGIVDQSTPPDFTITDGAAGVVVSRARGGERGAISNVVVVDGRTNDDGSAAPHAEAAITATSSPIRAAGPYGRVVRFYASDLITTQGQADAAAASLLVTYATAGRAESATIVPDPRIELGDIARIFTSDGMAFTGRVTNLDLPLTPADAPMSVGIGMLPAGTIDGLDVRGGV